MREITVFTHRRPEDTSAALGLLVAAAADAGVRGVADARRTDFTATASYAIIGGYQGLHGLR